MRRIHLLLVLVLALPTSARYAIPDIEHVPSARILQNLQQQLKAKPADPNVHLQLARVYALVYAQKDVLVPVNRYNGSEQVSVEEPPQLGAAQGSKRYLDKAIWHYRKGMQLGGGYPVNRLGLAWAYQMKGDNDSARAVYRKILKAAEDNGSGHWRRDRSITGEAGHELVRLLDPVKDKAEIIRVQKFILKINSSPRPITPVLIPLTSHTRFHDLVDLQARVPFDLDGSGEVREWPWPRSGRAGWLVFDPTNSKRIRSGLQMFGSVTFWMFWNDGYQAMAALDDNSDGWLTDDELRGLAVWRDDNMNGLSEPTEVLPLEALGIDALNCKYNQRAHDHFTSQTGVKWSNGATTQSYDWIPTPTPPPSPSAIPNAAP